MTLDPGVRLGTYEILGPLGAGGMGEVYRARDRKLGREVALKILSEAFASDPARVARFEREARMLAAVNHPAIAAIYGAEEDGDFRYIVMELVPGETLSEKLAGGALPIPEALGLAEQIAEALAVAHEKGVIHRDLKPANIKVTPEGRVKVLDLGLAKAMEKTPSHEALSDSPTVVMDDSRPGAMLGTPGFMSPEQARGKDTDRRTDIWAFGCVLYEMLSGKRAFGGDNVPDILLSILDRQPDWGALPAATPARIKELLVRCLEKDANRRLRDAGDARLEIEAARRELAGQAPGRRAAAWPTAAAVLAAGALVLGASLALRPSGRETVQASLPGHMQLAVLPFRNLTSDPNAGLLAVALVETVSVRLSGLPGLQIVTPTAVVSAADRDSEVLRIARNLGANVVVLGTLQREGDSVRITYRVLNTQEGVQIAANVLNGSASDLFALQDALADSVAKDLRLPGASHRPTAPPGLDGGQQERYLQAIGLLQRYDRRESVEKALGLLRGLADERPNSALVQAALGRANLAMFDFTKERSWADRALAAADAARRLDAHLPEVDVTIGKTLLSAGMARDAAEAFGRALAANPDDVQALLGLGRASGAAGDAAAAENAFRRAANLQPSSFAPLNQLGALYAGLGRYREAAAAFQRAARLAPDSYRVLSNLGGVETMQCDYVAALDAYRRALVLKPEDPFVLSNLGLTQLWLGRTADAVVSLEKAAEGLPTEYRIQSNLGDAYRAKGQSARAQEAYGSSVRLARDQLRLNPNDAAAHSFAATGLARTGHAAEALEESRRAVALEGGNPDILSDAAIVAAAAGRDTEALEWLRKAVAAGYCSQIIARQPEFAGLRENPAFRSLVAAPPRAAGS